MRSCLLMICASLLTSVALSQQPPATSRTVDDKPAASSDSPLKAMFESKIKAEWEALKNKDKKAYGDMLADDYQGVENDGQGERNKLQAINEVMATNVFNYTLFGLKVVPAGPDAAFVVYEVTMQFPPRSQVRYSRVYVGELWVKRGEQWKMVHYQETPVK
jgi:ketosteroid isomerase-like protein